MKWPTLPTGADKPSWAGLCGTAGMAYVFVDPYRLGASWIEWSLTGLAFGVFFVLAIIGCVYWSRRHIVQRVCIGMAALGVAFTAYRPSGICFFIFIPALAPFAVGGNIRESAVITIGIVLIMVVQTVFLWTPGVFLYVAVIETILIGLAFTVVARTQMNLRHVLKTSERERIARDLHDILGHTLSVIILKSELASRLIDQDVQRAKDEIQDVERISRSALSEVREAIRGYRAGDLRVEFERARATLQTAGIAVEQHCEPAELPSTHERVLALVLREAVTNIVRHAHAKRCSMRLQRDEHVYRLEIKDDGRGGVYQEGMGMRGIRERIAAIGGQVAWSADSGTALTITVPSATKAGETA